MPKATLLALLLIISTEAWACSCSKESVAERYVHATTIVRARVVTTSLHENPRAKDEPFNPEIVRATVKVLEILKGTGKKLSQVESGSNYRDPVCNIALLAGAEYLFVLESGSAVTTCNSWLLDGAQEGNEMLQGIRALKGGK